MLELQRLAALTPDWDWSASAVIARKWEYLAPVRAWCELHGVPVQMGNEQIPNFWRLRETQALRDWLRGARKPTSLMVRRCGNGWPSSPPAVGPSCCTKPPMNSSWKPAARRCPPPTASNGWRSGGREVRRRQRGLLLLTAHSAKGLEFDHVVVLDGGWRSAKPRRGRRCAASPALCGHDPRPQDLDADALSEAVKSIPWGCAAECRATAHLRQRRCTHPPPRRGAAAPRRTQWNRIPCWRPCQAMRRCCAASRLRCRRPPPNWNPATNGLP